MSKLNWNRSDKQKQIIKSNNTISKNPTIGGNCDSFSPSNIEQTRNKIERLKQLRLSQQS